jgi:NitT/TauT family transport system permease protein
MDKALRDTIPAFGRKAAPQEVGLSGVSAFDLGGHRTKLEVLVIALVAVVIIGGAELLLRAFQVPQYILPTPSEIATALVTEWPFIWPHLLVTLQELLLGFAIGASAGFVLAAVIT